jgi:hypothetical protein
VTPAAIRSALEALRKSARALRARSAAETLESLGTLLDAWRTPDSRPRRELERRLPEATGFSAEVVRAGLAHALAPLSGDALARLVESELGGADALEGRGPLLADGFETTGVVLAGALPTPTLMALLAPLVLRSGVLAKESSHDPVTARCLRESLEEIDPALGGCLEVASFPGADEPRMQALLEADCVVASGSDATIAAVARRVRPPRRMVLRGHRLSLAVVGPRLGGADALDAWARAVAFDVALWDQLGCLSPVAVMAAGAEQTDALAEALAGALEHAETRWPLGRVPGRRRRAGPSGASLAGPQPASHRSARRPSSAQRPVARYASSPVRAGRWSGRTGRDIAPPPSTASYGSIPAGTPLASSTQFVRSAPSSRAWHSTGSGASNARWPSRSESWAPRASAPPDASRLPRSVGTRMARGSCSRWRA